jgi:hypothetical protein
MRAPLWVGAAAVLRLCTCRLAGTDGFQTSGTSGVPRLLLCCFLFLFAWSRGAQKD